MKRVLILFLALFVVTGIVAAESTGLEPLMAPGDLAVTAGVGYGFLWGAIDVSGGIELMLGKFMIGDTIPLTYGVAGKASYYNDSSSFAGDWNNSYLGAGGFGTLHLGLKDLGLPEGMGFLANVDTYIGLGLGFYSYTWGWSGSTDSEFRLGFRSAGGANYFINDKLAITFEGGYYGYYGGGLIGVLFKL